MRQEVEERIGTIIRVHEQECRGVSRAAKGKWMKRLTRQMVELAWLELGGGMDRIETKTGRCRIPIRPEYVRKMKERGERMPPSIEEYFHDAKIDSQVLVDGRFVLGMKSSIYTQNAWLKNTLVDFHLLKSTFPEIGCYLFQLENPPEKDCRDREDMMYGSLPTHTLMSHYPDVGLRIFTFRERRRRTDRPRHEPEFHGSFKKERAVAAIELLAKDLVKYL